MAKNKVQFQSGYSLPKFFKDYGNDKPCEAALFQWKWPSGFACPACGSTHYCALRSRKIYQCHQCHHQTTLIKDTIFENTNLPLSLWFLSISLVSLYLFDHTIKKWAFGLSVETSIRRFL